MKTLTQLAVISLLLLASTAKAVEPLSADDLQRYCENYETNPQSILSEKCRAYVGGFLDGAVATDERVAQNVAKEIEEEESFAQRAVRTRIANRLERFGPSVYAEFCIGRPVPILDVILHVVEELDSRESLENAAARNIVYSAVRKHYPCE